MNNIFDLTRLIRLRSRPAPPRPVRAALFLPGLLGLWLGVIPPAAAINSISQAPVSSANHTWFYYQIGGARSISEPANIGVSTHTFNASTQFGLGYSCGKFNPTLGLTNLLNNLSNTGNNLINGAVGAVTSAIGALPALILQRVDPGLYDLFHNAMLRVRASLAMANASCQQYEQQIRQGKNPYAGWTHLSKAIDWKVQMGAGGYGSSGVDVVQAQKNVESADGGNGFPWVGGQQAGGVNQPPARVTQDTVKAGYNMTLNRNPADTTAPVQGTGLGVNPPPAPRLVQLFSDPAQASKWAVDVLGDTYVQTHDNHTPQTVPGYGLRPKIEKTMVAVQNHLANLVSGQTSPTLSHLNQVSTANILVNKDVIDAIQGLQPDVQAVVVSKLASEVAMSREVEKALMVRRLLLTGSQEPNVSHTPATSGPVLESVAQLDRSINDVLFERRVHNELASQTPAAILKLASEKVDSRRGSRMPAGSDAKTLDRGAVQ